MDNEQVARIATCSCVYRNNEALELLLSRALSSSWNTYT
ncbi:MAG: hypothetical protein ACI8T1_001340 [Verrucomicrobiales bacterium]|jgi:hypothetical protein